MRPQHFLRQQRFFRRPTNVSKRLCVVSLAPKQLRYGACKSVVKLALHCMIIHMYITTHEALGALPTTLTVTTNLQSTVKIAEAH